MGVRSERELKALVPRGGETVLMAEVSKIRLLAGTNVDRIFPGDKKLKSLSRISTLRGNLLYAFVFADNSRAYAQYIKKVRDPICTTPLNINLFGQTTIYEHNGRTTSIARYPDGSIDVIRQDSSILAAKLLEQLDRPFVVKIFI